jgi:hypothetical protein
MKKQKFTRYQNALLKRNIEWYEADEETRAKMISKAWTAALRWDRDYYATDEEHIEREIRYRREEWEKSVEPWRSIIFEQAHYDALREDDERDGMSESEWQERKREAEAYWADRERKDEEFVDKVDKFMRLEEAGARTKAARWSAATRAELIGKEEEEAWKP